MHEHQESFAGSLAPHTDTALFPPSPPTRRARARCLVRLDSPASPQGSLILLRLFISGEQPRWVKMTFFAGVAGAAAAVVVYLSMHLRISWH